MAAIGGTVDGTNSDARFYNPTGITVDTAGNLYIADQLNHTIRMVSPVGTNWVVTTLAGLARTLGSANGTNTDARFSRPSGIAVDSSGNVFVADTYNNIVREITRQGTNWVVTTIAGTAGVQGYDNGTNGDASFHSTQAVAVDQNDNLFVADRLNFTVREIIPLGTNWFTTTIAGLASMYGGFVDGTNGDAEFNLPFGITVDAAGALFVADFGNNAIREVSPIASDWVTTTVTGFSGAVGTNDGPASVAMFNSPNGIAVDAAGDLFVADQYNNTIRKLVPAGNSWMVSTIGGLAGHPGSANGVGPNARFYRPWGIAVDAGGNLFIADAYNDTIRMGVLSIPSLRIALSGAQIVLSWPVSSSNYVLETTTVLRSGYWTPLTNGISVSGDQFNLKSYPGPESAFFRLHKQ